MKRGVSPHLLQGVCERLFHQLLYVYKLLEELKAEKTIEHGTIICNNKDM